MFATPAELLALRCDTFSFLSEGEAGASEMAESTLERLLSCTSAAMLLCEKREQVEELGCLSMRCEGQM